MARYPKAITNAVIDQPSDFSLVQGGPLYQLLLRSGLVSNSMGMLARRIIVIAGIAWVPLLVLTLVSGDAIGGRGVPFLYDLGAHARLLLSIPMLIATEVVVHRRIKTIVWQFLECGIIAPEDQVQFDRVNASAMILRNSMVVEVLMLAFVLFGAFFIGRRYVGVDIASWFAAPVGDGTQMTGAGYWYIFVSLTIFRFLLLRWYFRMFVWYRFLWQVSRYIPLQLNALHPDRAGGLGFLSGSPFAFQPLLIAHMIALAGILGGKILNEGATLPQFKMEITFWLIFLILLVVTPLFFFMIHLSTAKRIGLREYGIVGSHYVSEFRGKWIEGHPAKNEALIGTADIQSLADLANSFEVVNEMRVMPFGRASVLRLAVIALLPLAPLLLTMFPLEHLIDRAFRLFM